MDKVIFFGTNELNKDPKTEEPLVSPPDLRFCNLMLAIMRVLHESGAAEVLEQLREDDERSREGGSGVGTSEGFDDLFVAKLNLIQMSQSVRASSRISPT
jgi:hypothetical protein